MYILDNDGLANSDKRFPTKLRNNRNGWTHDEISGWVSTDGEEMTGILESRWMRYDDSQNGTEWINEKGEKIKMKKSMFLQMANINEDNFYNLLPEFYLRPYQPIAITDKGMAEEISKIEKEVEQLQKLI